MFNTESENRYMRDIIRVLKKYKQIMSRGQKLRIFVIILMMLIGGALETVSVSLVIPLVTAIMTPDFVEQNKYAKMICEIFDLHSSNSFMMLVIICLIMIYFGKNLFLYFEYYVQTRFACNNRFALQRSVMQVYINKPYEFFLNESTATVLQVVNGDVSAAFSLLSTLMGLFTELTISVALIVTIIVVDPIMAMLVAMILLSLMIFLGAILKPILRQAGVKTRESNAIANKWLIQSMHGIKEVKVANKEEFFVEQYSRAGKISVECEKKNTVLNNVPRLMIESVTVSAMLGVIAVLLYNGKDVTDLMPQLSAFAMAAVRLLPSTNRISTAYNKISYQEPMLDKVLETVQDISNYRKTEKESIGINKLLFEEKVELCDITYRYPNTDKNVLNHASMVIPVGKSVGIIGTSGAGKTTAVDVLLGLLKPIEGSVLSDGISVDKDYYGWLSHLSYIPQTIYMLDDTIRANVAFGCEIDSVDDSRIWNAIREAQLEEFVNSLPEGLDTFIGEQGVRLSGGQRQRIGIARALYTDPELIILDEATSALDNETEAAIMDAINSLHGKKTLVIIAHRLTTIKECDMIYRVENGSIVLEK